MNEERKANEASQSIMLLQGPRAGGWARPLAAGTTATEALKQNWNKEYRNTKTEYRNTKKEYRNTKTEYRNTKAEYRNIKTEYRHTKTEYRHTKIEYRYSNTYFIATWNITLQNPESRNNTILQWAHPIKIIIKARLNVYFFLLLWWS